MYFCPQCNYSFDITKSSSTIKKVEIDTPNELFKLLTDKNIDLNKYTLKFKESDIIKNNKYKKLSSELKDTIKNIFQDNSIFENIEFKCLNCNFRKPISSSIKLYEINLVDDNKKSIKSIDDNKLLFNNPIYPRTKDYTCKNLNCITHKDKSKKEAIFYKDKDYQLVYICGNCYSNWGI